PNRYFWADASWSLAITGTIGWARESTFGSTARNAQCNGLLKFLAASLKRLRSQEFWEGLFTWGFALTFLMWSSQTIYMNSSRFLSEAWRTKARRCRGTRVCPEILKSWFCGNSIVHC